MVAVIKRRHPQRRDRRDKRARPAKPVKPAKLAKQVSQDKLAIQGRRARRATTASPHHARPGNIALLPIQAKSVAWTTKRKGPIQIPIIAGGARYSVRTPPVVRWRFDPVWDSGESS